MANKEHLKQLLASISSGGSRLWNDWRIDNPELLPELASLELFEANLPFVNLSKADLRMANLRLANFYNANLENSDLSYANLEGANLRGANMSGSKLYKVDLAGADLQQANLRGADLRGASFAGARLKGVDLAGILIEPEAFESLFEESLSRLERFALRLSKGKRSKQSYPVAVNANKVEPSSKNK